MVNSNLQRPRSECFMCLENVVVTVHGKLAVHREQKNDPDSRCCASGMTVRVWSEESEAWLIPRKFKGIDLKWQHDNEMPKRLTIRQLIHIRKTAPLVEELRRAQEAVAQKGKYRRYVTRAS